MQELIVTTLDENRFLERMFGYLDNQIKIGVQIAFEKQISEEFIKKEEPLITKKEMAKELDISLVTLTSWMKILPYRKIEGRVYFIRSEVRASMRKFNYYSISE